jgi:hypothetical protein
VYYDFAHVVVVVAVAAAAALERPSQPVVVDKSARKSNTREA